MELFQHYQKVSLELRKSNDRLRAERQLRHVNHHFLQNIVSWIGLDINVLILLVCFTQRNIDIFKLSLHSCTISVQLHAKMHNFVFEPESAIHIAHKMQIFHFMHCIFLPCHIHFAFMINYELLQLLYRIHKYFQKYSFCGHL